MRGFLTIVLVILACCVGCDKPSEKFKVLPPKYPVLTTEILEKIPDDGLEFAILDHINGKIGGDYERAHRIVLSMPKGFQMVYATWWVEAEVNNGGFNQYFWNPSGEFQNEALAGYKLIGALEHGKLLAEAMRGNQEIQATQEKFKRAGTIKAFGESYKDNPLNKLDDRFYEFKEDASALRIRFIRQNKESFISRSPALETD